MKKLQGKVRGKRSVLHTHSQAYQLRDVKWGASSGRNGKENTARPVLFNYALCQILLAFADAQRLLPTEGRDCNLDTACTWNLSVLGSTSEK